MINMIININLLLKIYHLPVFFFFMYFYQYTFINKFKPSEYSCLYYAKPQQLGEVSHCCFNHVFIRVIVRMHVHFTHAL